MAKLKEGKRTHTSSAFGKLVFTEDTALLIQEGEDGRLIYDIGAMLDEFEGEMVSVTIKREKTLATVNSRKAMRGVRDHAADEDDYVPDEPEEAEQSFGSREALPSVY